jgi:hypothetical protein
MSRNNLIAVIIILAIIGFVLWDWVITHLIEILSLGGVGGGAIYASKKKKEKHQVIAEDSINQMDVGIDKSQAEMLDADKIHCDTDKIAKEINETKEPTHGSGFIHRGRSSSK